jgi:pimeloyl-ACP methyl ester carboxylesterase
MYSSAPKNRTVVRSRNAVRLTRAALQTAYVVSEDLGTRFAERLFTTPRRHARPDRERAVLASARELSIEVTLRAPRWNGATIRIAGWHWGTGPTVLLVHGWEGRDDALLVVHDRDDREVPIEHGRRLAATWPLAELRETDGLGHRRILRDPNVVATAVAFVREGVQPPASDLVREIDRWLDPRSPS